MKILLFFVILLVSGYSALALPYPKPKDEEKPVYGITKNIETLFLDLEYIMYRIEKDSRL